MIPAAILYAVFWKLSARTRVPRADRKRRRKKIIAELSRGERSLAELQGVFGRVSWLGVELFGLMGLGQIERRVPTWFTPERPLEEQTRFRLLAAKPSVF